MAASYLYPGSLPDGGVVAAVAAELIQRLIAILGIQPGAVLFRSALTIIGRFRLRPTHPCAERKPRIGGL